jgi:hypothetical protein
MLAAAQKQIADLGLRLDDAPQLAFDQVALIFKNALELIQNDHDGSTRFLGQSGRRS